MMKAGCSINTTALQNGGDNRIDGYLGKTRRNDLAEAITDGRHTERPRRVRPTRFYLRLPATSQLAAR